MGQIMLGNYTVTTCNFFVITMQYITVVLSATVTLVVVKLSLKVLISE